MLINIERTAFLEVNSLQKYKKLFFSTFELSACTFGGGFVIIPLMRKKFVEELGWISIISMFYQAFRDNAIVNMAMAGMLCGVAAVICDVVINMAKTIFQKKRLLPVIVMLGSFVAVRFFSVNIIVIILVCGVIGAADTWHQGKMRKVGDKR